MVARYLDYGYLCGILVSSQHSRRVSEPILGEHGSHVVQCAQVGGAHLGCRLVARRAAPGSVLMRAITRSEPAALHEASARLLRGAYTLVCRTRLSLGGRQLLTPRYGFATLLSIYNKWMFSADYYNFPYPLFVTACHMVVQFVIASLIRVTMPDRFRPPEKPTRRDYAYVARFAD